MLRDVTSVPPALRLENPVVHVLGNVRLCVRAPHPDSEIGLWYTESRDCRLARFACLCCGAPVR